MDETEADQYPDDPGISAEEIEAEYQRAVEAMDDADWEIPAEIPAEQEADSASIESALEAEEQGAADAKDGESVAEEAEKSHRFDPAQILEASLFVGGQPLSSKKLASLLGGSFDSSGVQALIDEMNQTYAAENRPYELRLGEGGYSLALRESFARVRNRVYGVGPREVKLSQDALEMLAFVAYQQPVTREQAEETGKKNWGGLLSQLVRRQLIAIERDEENPKQISYHTTPRFLSVFGIGGLEELPQADLFDQK